MEHIRQLFSSLSRVEVRYLLTYLEAFPGRGENKALEFVKLLRKSPTISNEEMGRLLYGDYRSKAYSMLKRRLYDRMIDTLTLSINLEKNPDRESYTEELVATQVHKQLAYVNLLTTRGLKRPAREILNKAIKLVQRTEKAGLRALVASHLINQSDDLSQLLDIYQKEFDTAVAQLQIDVNCQIHLRQFDLMMGPTGSVQLEGQDLLAVIIPELETQLARTPTVRGQYTLLMLQLQSALLYDRHFEQAHVYWQALDRLLQAHPSFASPARLATLHLQKARLGLQVYDIHQSQVSALHAQSLVLDRDPVYFTASVYLWFGHFYQGALDECQAVIRMLENREHPNRNIARHALIEYFEMCQLFVMRHFSEALNTNPQQESLMQDKTGWNVGVRMMEIMTLVELGYDELIPNKLDNLRKHLQKYAVCPRIKGFYRAILRLDRSGYDFEVAASQLRPLIEEQAPWQPVTYEIIDWVSWVDAHLRNQSYYASFFAMIQTQRPLYRELTIDT